MTDVSTDAAHQRWWQIAEVVFGIPMLIAIVLQMVAPISFPGDVFTPVFILVGAALFVAGLVLVVLARQQFGRSGQPTDPGRPTSQIVTTGVFSISRNPLYLGAVCMLGGIGLVTNALWVLIWLVPAVVACQVILIRPEERYLTAKFGEEYIRYTAGVRRWVGRKL